jgi:hypothetical protein
VQHVNIKLLSYEDLNTKQQFFSEMATVVLIMFHLLVMTEVNHSETSQALDQG